MTKTVFRTDEQSLGSQATIPRDRSADGSAAPSCARRTRGVRASERGQVIAIFALLLPVLFAMSAVVIGIGNWYVHARHLQTKADAGAFAGGDSWEFPCGSQIDARIDAQARLYAGSNNPQVGGVPDSNVHSVLNGTDWYDDDSNPAPVQNNLFPPNTTLCAAGKLDVKVTEDNSFPLASLMPLFPDIKRRARVEIQEAEGISGLLPIAVRAPEPVSAAAVFFNEANGNILSVKYFVKNSGIIGLPANLQGWSGYNSEDPTPWANFSPAAATGVAIAVSLRGACNTGLPNPNTKISTAPNGCFEDAGFSTVDQLCNQGSSVQIVDCYYTGNTTWPSQSVRAGLQFIRGYPAGGPTTSPPLGTAFLENVSCISNGYSYTYLYTHPNNSCLDRLRLELDLSAYTGTYPNSSPPPAQVTAPLRASDVQVRYRVVRGDGSSFCDYGTSCDVLANSATATGGTVGFSTTGSGTSPHLSLTATSQENAVAIEVRLRNASGGGLPAVCSNPGFSANCRWFYTGNGMFSNSTAPTNAQILAAPVQRAFRGDTVSSGPVRWLRLTADRNCDGAPEFIDADAASQPTGNRCFFVDMGLKGGLATDADEEPILFNDGIGSSQMGSVDCDPGIGQGQILTDGVQFGCSPWYARHPFDWSPACPSANNLFANYPTGNPGPPWDDGRWPPIRCIKTRPTGSMNQLEDGLNLRFFDDKTNPSCPPDAAGFVKGRNYWDQDTNALNNREFGYKDDSPLRDTHFSPADPRVVTIFVTTSDGFTGSGQNSYPITAFVEVYITGYGRISSGSLNSDDPCPGDTAPTDLNLGSGNASGYAVWGHIINVVIPGPNATPSDIPCNPGGSTQPCVATLVE